MPIELSDEQSLAIDTNRLVSLATHVLAHHDVHVDTAVGILAVDEEAMAELNREHMGKSGPTDVLAFPVDAPHEVEAGPAVLGDVVLCPAVAYGQASDHGRSAEDELALLLVHGLLHLLGMDHATPEDEATMFGLTDQLLASHRASA
ncbi:MAG: rRNA maturation RNase YbeY [Nitriliruptorales bacterium]|nr:rRNA maturation RNase YbeY [Nitriliruptorales bacterium]